MAEHGGSRRVAILSASWEVPYDEASFAVRSVAAAMSRLAPVDVLVPGPAGPARPDGAFDLVSVGGAGGADAHGAEASGMARATASRRWPGPHDADWPIGLRAPAAGPDAEVALAVVDDADPGARILADHFLPGVPTMVLVSRSGGPGSGGPLKPGVSGQLAVGIGSRPAGPCDVGLHVPVHALAASRRHVGLGFTDYVLVLGDRGPDAADDPTPTPSVAWLAARFAGRYVVVVENAVASVWRSRSLRGRVDVHTRTDLWRLVAHARMTVDLAPGPLLARECVESLRYGVPIVVPAGTPGAHLAGRGGGLWFEDEAELLGCIEALDDQAVRDTLGAQGKAVADERYGDAGRFVERVGKALATVG